MWTFVLYKYRNLVIYAPDFDTNYQVSKAIVHDLEFGDIAAMQIHWPKMKTLHFISLNTYSQPSL